METWPQINPEALSALIDERNTLLHDLLEARERLAAVEALCDAAFDYRISMAEFNPMRVRAAARGEVTP